MTTFPRQHFTATAQLTVAAVLAVSRHYRARASMSRPFHGHQAGAHEHIDERGKYIYTTSFCSGGREFDGR